MKEELITYETALLAKKKGFNISTRNFIADLSWNDKQIYSCDEVGYPNFTNDMGSSHGFGDIINVSSQSLLQKWLREKYDIHVETFFDETYSTTITKNGKWYNSAIDYNTYEKALEKGLQEALKLIKL